MLEAKLSSEEMDDFLKTAEKWSDRCSVSAEDRTKYQHHILPRRLTGPASTPEERSACSERSGKWSVGAGHPRETIGFYRALPVGDREEKIKHLQKAYDIAMTGEGIMHVIAAVILGSLILLRPEREKQYLELVEQCAVEIPALGSRIDILRGHVGRRYAPLEPAASILPFNFR